MSTHEGATFESAVWTGREVLLFSASRPVDCTLGYRYEPGADRWQAMSRAGAPSQRTGHSSVWTGTELIVWGGSYHKLTNDGARYNPQTDQWTPISLNGAPSPRLGHVAVWTGSEMLIWGGVSPGLFLTNGAAYNPATDSWRPLAPVNTLGGPSYYDAFWTGTEMVLWSKGTNPGGRYNPATDSWRSISNDNAPPRSFGHSTVWSRSELIVWGQFSVGNQGEVSSAGYRYHPLTDTWRSISTNSAPARRFDPLAVWTGEVMLIWGRTDQFDIDSKEIHRYYPASDSWQSSPKQIPIGNSVPTSSELLVWNGVLWTVYRPVTDSMESLGLSEIVPAGSPSTGVWTGEEAIFWGQNSRSNVRYDFFHDRWRPLSRIGSAYPRNVQKVVWTGREMLLWGGYADCVGGVCGLPATFDDGARYHARSDSWKPIPSPSPPQRLDNERTGNTTVWTGREMLVWGGAQVNGFGISTRPLGTGWRYDPFSDTWRPISIHNAPEPRVGHTAIWTGTEMIVWGGRGGTPNSFHWLNSGARYNPDSDEWVQLSTAQAPSPRQNHSAVWTGREMIIWGGSFLDYTTTVTTNSGGRYDVFSDRWSGLDTTNAPSPRENHAAFWTGTEMLVLGGLNRFGYLNDGGRFNPGANHWTPIVPEPGMENPWGTLWIGDALLFFHRGGGCSPPTVSIYAPDSAYAADGIPDAWQLTHFGENNPALAHRSADPDGDGQNNYFEYTAGTLPTDPNSQFRLTIARPAGHPPSMRISFAPRFADRHYEVLASTNVAQPLFLTPVRGISVISGERQTVFDPDPGPSKFYQLLIQRNPF